MNPTWTMDELRDALPRLRASIEEAEKDYPEARALPPMNIGECKEMFERLLGIAAERALTLEECFLSGQLLSQFQQASWAEALGYKGRHYVVTDDKIEAIVRGPR